jgi:amino acid transporter/nucleotide-binding universal stress UspA family protein
MSNDSQSPAPSSGIASRLQRPIEVIIVSSVMFTFISYWRTAAVVLCDLASTAYYIGGIVEGAIGPAAPWFILAVMLFSYAVRSIYIESCSLFVRGGVYRVVKEALGGFLAKFAVSALMFDYILTGPISGMSAGLYIMGLILDTLAIVQPEWALGHDNAEIARRAGAMVIACLITIYFFRQNLIGIHESSGKALKIMAATTVMGVVILVWCGITLAVRGPVNSVPMLPDLSPKMERQVITGVDRVTGEEKEMWNRDPATGKFQPEMEDDGSGTLVPKAKINEVTGRPEDPLGFLTMIAPSLAKKLHEPGNWWSLIGILGLMIAFGHSVLAMSGEETLAQVYREVESPKLPNFKKAAFIVFIYSLFLTATISFLAVLLIPDEVRMKTYSDNLIGGLAMYVVGPPLARLCLNGFVVIIGFLILAGAVNTAIIGSNGVLNRVAEDGVLPDWFLKPHRRYGTTHRLLYVIIGFQLATILISRGDMYILGEAYAFGVVWSFVFQAASMVVLRFKDRSPREFKVPFNIRIRGVEVPVGLCIILVILLMTAVLNFLTKEVATIGGMAFTAVFFTTFMLSERYHEKKRGAAAHKHLEQFNSQTADEVSPETFNLTHPYRKLVAIRSSQNLFMLEKALAETDPETTDVVVMTAKFMPAGNIVVDEQDFDHYDRDLMTSVVTRAEAVGKQVRPLIVPTNNPLFAVISTAHKLRVQELVMGASNKYTADEQLEQIAFYWISLHEGCMAPLTVRILSRTRDVSLDLGGGSRIPKISERQARSVAELRSAGVGVSHAMLVHANKRESSDLFEATLTMLDPQVALTVLCLPEKTENADDSATNANWIQQNAEQAKQLRRDVEFHTLAGKDIGAEIVQYAEQEDCDLLIVAMKSPTDWEEESLFDPDYLVRHASCYVCVVAPPPIPQTVVEP